MIVYTSSIWTNKSKGSKVPSLNHDQFSQATWILLPLQQMQASLI
jgi:hypothetical protein